jgi:hypothetical protein
LSIDDAMHDATEGVRAHYRPFANWLARTPADYATHAHPAADAVLQFVMLDPLNRNRSTAASRPRANRRASGRAITSEM